MYSNIGKVLKWFWFLLIFHIWVLLLLLWSPTSSHYLLNRPIFSSTVLLRRFLLWLVVVRSGRGTFETFRVLNLHSPWHLPPLLPIPTFVLLTNLYPLFVLFRTWVVIVRNTYRSSSPSGLSSLTHFKVYAFCPSRRSVNGTGRRSYGLRNSHLFWSMFICSCLFSLILQRRLYSTGTYKIFSFSITHPPRLNRLAYFDSICTSVSSHGCCSISKPKRVGSLTSVPTPTWRTSFWLTLCLTNLRRRKEVFRFVDLQISGSFTLVLGDLNHYCLCRIRVSLNETIFTHNKI